MKTFDLAQMECCAQPRLSLWIVLIDIMAQITEQILQRLSSI